MTYPGCPNDEACEKEQREALNPTLDFDARYSVAGMPGVAWYLRGYHEEWGEIVDDWDERELVTDYNMVRAVMVGDDREHIIDVDDLTKLEDEDYCHQCGQIGCTHDGR